MPEQPLPGPEPAAGKPPGELRADCARCAGLCCVAPAFSASADFAVDKPAGQPCRHLGPDFRCGIHSQLRQRGFAGCAVFDCFGAGQQVTQVTFGGQDWRSAPAVTRAMGEAFAVMRALHELLWHLAHALTLEAARPLHPEIRRAFAQTERLTLGSAQELAQVDLAGLRAAANSLLLRASELTRAGADPAGSDLRGADLAGRDLRRAQLRAASLRGACLIGADLRGVDLTLADVTGADLRAADLRGADLRGAIFLSQPQLEAASGDERTAVPGELGRPAHWQAASTGPAAPVRPGGPAAGSGPGPARRRPRRAPGRLRPPASR